MAVREPAMMFRFSFDGTSRLLHRFFDQLIVLNCRFKSAKMPVYNTPATQNLLKRASYSPPYRSPYGPQYTVATHWHGFTLPKVTKFGTIAAGFGVSAGLFAAFFFGEVPRVRKDIWQRFPLLDTYYDRTIPAEDNPF